jgi:Baseplate J-like protein
VPDLPSRLDLYSIGRSYVLARARRIDPAQVDVLGSDVNLFVGSQSLVAFSIVRQLAFRTNALLLDGAEGEDLDRYVFDRYQQARKGASAALGSVRFFRASSALGAGAIPIGTTLRTLTGVEYVTTTIGSFGPTAIDGITANVRASQAGKEQQVGANQIRAFSNPQALFDQTIQVTNDKATAGGEPAEDDDTFRNRIRGFWLAARRGVKAAIEFGAKQTPGVVSAMAIEAINADSGDPARIVNLYIADSSGVASAALGQLVQTQLLDFRAAGITVLTSLSLPDIISIQLRLSFVGGTDTVTLANNVIAAVVEFVNSLPVNAPLLLLQLGGVLQRFAPDGLVPNFSSIVSPAGDLFPPLGQSIRTTPANVTLVL